MTNEHKLREAHSTIAGVIQSWLDYQLRDNPNATDDTHLMSPPIWPTRGTLKNWIKALQPPTSDDGTPLTDAFFKAWDVNVVAFYEFACDIENRLHAKERELERRKQKEEFERELDGKRFATLGIPSAHPLHPDNALHNRAFQYWHDTMVGVGAPGFPVAKEKLLDLVRESVSAAPQEGKAAFECAARKQGTAGGNDPAECDWPMCGCDPYADRVIAALQESGAINWNGHWKNK